MKGWAVPRQVLPACRVCHNGGMPKRRVLYDAGPMLDGRKSGVGYYVGHLITSLQAAYGDRLELTGYYFNFLGRHGDKTAGFRQLHLHNIRLVPGKLLSLSRRMGFQPWLECFFSKSSDAVLFTNYVALPLLRRRKVVLVIYDLSFLDVPEYTQTRNLSYLRRFCPPSIRRADTIITISEFTKQRLQHYFPELHAQIVVTPVPPLDEPVHVAALSQRLLDLGVKDKSYILCVGTLEPRKNLENLMTAYARLPAEVRNRYSLVLAGGKGWKDQPILDAIVKHRAGGLNIIQTGYVSDDEKAALYSHAAAFVQPSHYEGFGMPILEAMQHGLPVAVSDIPVFHEVAGNGALYFDKDDPADIADKLHTLLTDGTAAARLVGQAAKQLKTFSWPDNVAKVHRALE